MRRQDVVILLLKGGVFLSPSKARQEWGSEVNIRRGGEKKKKKHQGQDGKRGDCDEDGETDACLSLFLRLKKEMFLRFSFLFVHQGQMKETEDQSESTEMIKTHSERSLDEGKKEERQKERTEDDECSRGRRSEERRLYDPWWPSQMKKTQAEGGGRLVLSLGALEVSIIF